MLSRYSYFFNRNRNPTASFARALAVRGDSRTNLPVRQERRSSTLAQKSIGGKRYTNPTSAVAINPARVLSLSVKMTLSTPALIRFKSINHPATRLYDSDSMGVDYRPLIRLLDDELSNQRCLAIRECEVPSIRCLIECQFATGLAIVSILPIWSSRIQGDSPFGRKAGSNLQRVDNSSRKCQ